MMFNSFTSKPGYGEMIFHSIGCLSSGQNLLNNRYHSNENVYIW